MINLCFTLQWINCFIPLQILFVKVFYDPAVSEFNPLRLS